ncbi:MAG: lysophospholipid acyltransferase family protein [Anaerolineales bacterium]
MSLVSIANSRWGPNAAMWLVRILPRRFTLWTADRIAARIARQVDTAMVAALRSNQSVVQGLPEEDPKIQETVEAVIRNTIRSYISLFEVIEGGHETLAEFANPDIDMLETAEEILAQGRGLIYVGAHTIGLDHLLIYLGGLDYPTQVLAYPEVMPSYQAQNDLRRRFGLNLSPVSYQSLRRAITYLREGGVVVTAADRPDESGVFLEFFGKRAWLPVGHVRLAFKTKAPIMVGVTYSIDGGRYRAKSLGVIEPEQFEGRPDAEEAMAQQVILELEAFIRQHPDEWWMFHRVWPDGDDDPSER